MKNTKQNRLMPDGIPRYIRCYDNGGETFDRYTVVFTKKRQQVTKGIGQFLYVGMSDEPFSAQGFGQHGESDELIDRPKYSHLGKKISFKDLPHDCQVLVINDYKELWGIDLVLPSCRTYGEYVQRAVTKFGMTVNEVRDRYGLYSISQWECLLGTGEQ